MMIIIIIIITQDVSLQTNCHATEILQTETDSKCRLCKQFDEKVEHIILACPILAKEQYIKRHDRVRAKLYCNTCKETGLQLDSDHWYEQAPKLVETSHDCKVITLRNEQ